MHLADQLRRLGFLLATFVHERKHKAIKAACNSRECTFSFDAGVLEDVTMDQVYALKTHSTTGLYLAGSMIANRTLRNVFIADGVATESTELLTATKLFVNCRAVCKSDTVLYRFGRNVCFAGVQCHVQIDGQLWTCLEPWSIIDSTQNVHRCIVQDATVMVPSSCIIESCIFSPAAVGSIAQVLIPFNCK